MDCVDDSARNPKEGQPLIKLKGYIHVWVGELKDWWKHKTASATYLDYVYLKFALVCGERSGDIRLIASRLPSPGFFLRKSLIRHLDASLLTGIASQDVGQIVRPGWWEVKLHLVMKSKKVGPRRRNVFNRFVQNLVNKPPPENTNTIPTRGFSSLHQGEAIRFC